MIDDKIKWVLRPVAAELPFFILMALLLDYRAFYWTCKYPMGWQENWQQYSMLRFFSISLVYSFFLTYIVYYSRKELIKVFFYIIAVSLLYIDVFLFISTHSIISTNSFLLLSETNWEESRDFLLTYLYSLSGLLTLFLFVVLLLICYFVEKQRNRWINLYKHLSPNIQRWGAWILIIFLLTFCCWPAFRFPS